MIFPTILTISTLLSLTAAAPSSLRRQSTPYPPLSTTTSYNFALVANVTSGNLTSINNYVLTSYHTGAGTAYAVLIPNTTTTSARTFYINGTTSEIYFGTSSVLSDAGSGNNTFPEAIQMSPQDPEDADNGVSDVLIDAGEGQADVGLSQFSAEADPIVKLHGLDGEGFYACNNTLEFGSAIQLFYKDRAATTPVGCSDVTLLPQCVGGNGTHVDTQYGHNAVSCYDDVKCIDWSLY